MGINLGALFGQLIAGYLAQRVDWHLGFACAGVGNDRRPSSSTSSAASTSPAPRAGRKRDAAVAAASPTRGFTAAEWKAEWARSWFFFP